MCQQIKKLARKIHRDGFSATFNEFIRIILKKEGKIQPIRKYPFTTKDGEKIAHVSAFNFGNMGDTFLPVILRNLINQSIPVSKWIDIRVENRVDNRVVKEINSSKMCLVGGGGLLLRDTHENDVSGWQWNCSIPMLQRIDAPLVMFAVGYNRFRGQEEFKPIFRDSINLFVEKAAFVGLRNHGSIDSIKSYLDSEDLKKKVVFQPCMTTLTSLLYPDLVDYTIKENIIGLNCAFDRSERRMLSDSVLNDIASVMKKMSRNASIVVFAHMPADLQICPYLDKYSVKYKTLLFNSVEQMITEYSKCKIVIGMRGHAQMIPFGCLTPIVSIVSHDKIQWFLDDIGHPDWGVDVNNPDFESILYWRAYDNYSHFNERINDILISQQELWKITHNNIETIKSRIYK